MPSKLFNTLQSINWSHGRGDIGPVRYPKKNNRKRGYVTRTIPLTQTTRSEPQFCHFMIYSTKTGRKVKFLGVIRKIA